MLGFLMEGHIIIVTYTNQDTALKAPCSYELCVKIWITRLSTVVTLILLP